jgi:hypothetical protein
MRRLVNLSKFAESNEFDFFQASSRRLTDLPKMSIAAKMVV